MEKTIILTTEEYLKQVLVRRDRTAHKGDFGKILIYAGSAGMAGAAVLCGRAALKSGAGLVQYLLPDLKSPLLPILQISVPEATCVAAFDDAELEPPSGSGSGFPATNNRPDGTDCSDDLLPPFRKGFCLSDYTAIACGSGLGQSDLARAMLTRILETYEGTLLLDADALNMVAGSELLAEKTLACRACVIITPHIGEARRLLHTSDAIADPTSRQEAVCELARRYRCIAVLKGAGTLVTGFTGAGGTFDLPADLPDKEASIQIYQNTTGNPGMATAGSGDSLAGIITSLAAQGYSPLDSARLGVYIHGKAGDLAAEELGEMGVTSSDIVSYIPYAIKT